MLNILKFSTISVCERTPKQYFDIELICTSYYRLNDKIICGRVGNEWSLFFM